MGEIKSTLDLVMEKTRHLTLSKAEREDQRKAELKRILSGIVQKYQDEIFSPALAEKEINALKETYGGASITDSMKAVILEKLDLNQDNAKLIFLLGSATGSDVSRLETIVDGYRQEIKHLSEKRTAEKKKILAEKYLISGTAVVPNLESDEPLRAELEKIQSAYQARIEEEKAKIGF